MDEAVLIRYLKGTAGEEEKTKVEVWCEASPDNRKVLEQLYYMLFVADRVSAMNAVDVDRSLAKLKKAIGQKEKDTRIIRWKRYAVAIAAFVAGIVCTGGVLWGLLSDSTSQYTILTESGQRARAVLPDGTKVWLNASTTIEYQTSFFSSDRKVNLQGEAYFEVKKEEHAPFIVSAKGIETRVLGTKFNICAYNEEPTLKTTLLEGNVKVTFPFNEKEEVVMKPDQQLTVYLTDRKTQLVNIPDAKKSIGWIEGKLHFNRSTLKEIAETLEKHYDVHINIDDVTLQQQRFTCDFDLSDNIEQILSVLSLTNKFDYRIQDQEVRLTAR